MDAAIQQKEGGLEALARRAQQHAEQVLKLLALLVQKYMLY
jgi:hypothetical protein